MTEKGIPDSQRDHFRRWFDRWLEDEYLDTYAPLTAMSGGLEVGHMTSCMIAALYRDGARFYKLRVNGRTADEQADIDPQAALERNPAVYVEEAKVTGGEPEGQGGAS